MKNNNHIKCPKCNTLIDVNLVLYEQLNNEVSKEYNIKLSALNENEARLKETITNEVKLKVAEEKQRLENTIRQQIVEEKSEEISSYKDQLQKKIEETKEFYKAKAELERVKREKDELQGKIEAESEEKYTRRLNEEREKLKREVENKLLFKVSEKDHVIDQLKHQLSEAQRKAEQGSMQIQGEVQEVAIEDWVKLCFPQDEVKEVKKGARGADSLQIINTPAKLGCGSIYYESKRTKEFQQGWIEHFKADLSKVGATFGVLVTSALPKGMDRYGLRNGIWICTFHEFKALCFVLRESAIMIDSALVSQENKGDKMHMLYDYLTSSEFRHHIESIVDSFAIMSSDLDKEKRAFEGIWKKREKMIQKVLLNTNHLYSTVKGIAGNAVNSVKSLELPSGNDESEDKG